MPFLQNPSTRGAHWFCGHRPRTQKEQELCSVGAALVGAGGYAAATVYELDKAQHAATPPAAGTAGVEEDTGMLVAIRRCRDASANLTTSGKWSPIQLGCTLTLTRWQRTELSWG